MGKKRGPTPKPPDTAKTALIQIRISAAEKAELVQAAELDNRPLSNWIRDRLLRLSREELVGK